MSNELRVALSFIEAILSYNLTPDGISDLLEIHQGNKKIILGHLKAINRITGKAIEELEEENVSTSETKI